VAVCDESGNLVYFLRGDTCSFITFETSKGKAALAAGFRRPTNDYLAAARESPAFWTGVSAALGGIIGPGGYPITRDGALIGGIGWGGALGEEAHPCAGAGAKAVSSGGGGLRDERRATRARPLAVPVLESRATEAPPRGRVWRNGRTGRVPGSSPPRSTRDRNARRRSQDPRSPRVASPSSSQREPRPVCRWQAPRSTPPRTAR